MAGDSPDERGDNKRCQKDVEAHWTRKHGKTDYGYQNPTSVDRQHKVIRSYFVAVFRTVFSA